MKNENIVLVKNRGYKWSISQGIRFKGYFQYKDNLKVYRETQAIDELGCIHSLDQFKKFLETIDGCYSIVINEGNTVLAAVDRSRSMPLYMAVDGSVISDSAEEIRKVIGINREAVDPNNFIELFANYYLFGHKTVYAEIQQLDLGELCEIKKDTIHYYKYFWHLNQIHKTDNKDEIKKELSEVAYHCFERIKSAIAGRPVVLSMSGGYDSRFVGCMLKSVGVTDVSCYTYGKLSSFEVIQSKKNAAALGFRWNCVEMTDDLVSRSLDDVGQAYLESYTGHDFTAYMQNFAAVRELHEEGWFKPNSVFLTGLCGDMPTGEYVLEYDSTKEYSLNTAAEALYDLIYTRYILFPNHKTKWINEIKDQLTTLPLAIKDYHSWHQAVDCVYTGTCHVHWYMHMNSVHSFFDYEWLLPYWDKELLMVWYSVPSEFKVKQKLYEDWLMNVICSPFGLAQKKTIGGYVKKGWKRTVQYFVGGVLNYCLLHLGIPFKRKGDFSNFAPLELELFKHIKTRSCINYRRSGMMQLLENYLIERRYGSENLKYACKHVRSRQ